MRTYLILKEKATVRNENEQIKAILAEIEATNKDNQIGKFSAEGSKKLLAQEFDRKHLASKGLKYEKLDRLTIDILLGMR